MMKRLSLLALGLVLSLSAYAGTFNQFGPVTGVLKGSATSAQTSAAVYTDIVTMWTGCGTPSTKVLMADGTCAVPSAVTPAALTKTDDTNVTATLGGTPATALLQATSITLGWTGTLAASRGGLGMSTVTDDTVAVANGSAWQSKALTDCDAATSAVTYDTTTNAWGCNTINGATGANPSASVGLSAVNGAASTFMRSHGAPALSQSITPTWSAVHTFSARDVHSDGITINDSARNVAALVDTSQTYGNTTDNPTYTFAGTGAMTVGGNATFGGGASPRVFVNGTSSNALYGLQASGSLKGYFCLSVSAGSCISGDSANDVSIINASGPVRISNDNGATSRAVFNSGLIVGAPTGGDQGAGTVNATGLYVNGVSVAGGAQTTSTFTGTLTGVSGSVTCTMKYRKTGSAVALFVNAGGSCTGTSNATSLTMTGLPAAIRTTSNAGVPALCTDNSNDVPCLAVIGTGGTMTMYMGNPYNASGWTSTGVKGIGAVTIIVYDLRD